MKKKESEAYYGWVHVLDWLPQFILLGFGGLSALVLAIISEDVPAIVLTVVVNVLTCWPLVGYTYSWIRINPGGWYDAIVRGAVVSGNELILDLGCGLGRSTIFIAKSLRQGKVIGVDIYSKRSLWGNSLLRARTNAEIEGVSNLVDFQYGNALAIPFPDDHFDVVVSAYLTHELRTKEKRIKMMKEIGRVLRPGGLFVSGEIPRSRATFLRYLWFGYWFLPLIHLLALRHDASFEVLQERWISNAMIIISKKPNLT